MKLTPKVTYNTANINRIEADIIKAMIKTADDVRTDLMDSQTIPFDSGQLQNRDSNLKFEFPGTQIENSKASSGKVTIFSDTPYARRLYFHPEYHFSKDDNPNAGGAWFAPYINGAKKDYALKVFTVFMRKSLGG